MIPTVGGAGYFYVNLPHAIRSKRSRAIHVLVAAAFLGPCPDGQEINHKDGNKQNNCVENLEYVTRSENLAHAWRMGLNSGSTRLDATKIEQIKNEYAAGGISQTELARQYGVHQCHVSRIVGGKRSLTCP